MNILGLDIGFSVGKATNSFSLLDIDEKRKEIGLELARTGSQLFVFDSATCDQTAAPPLFDTFATRLSAQPLSRAGQTILARRGSRTLSAPVSLLPGDQVGSVDAPLTPVRLTDRPKSGRSVDKRFSKGVFHSSQGGPPPGSISVPLQGWPLYEAGMDVVGTFREAMLGDYGPFEGFEKAPSSGVIECIPKLTQALLVPREVVRERRGTVDDYLFPLLPEKEGPYRRRLDQALGD